MTSSIDTYLELYADVESAFFEDKECEHSQHQTRIAIGDHAGKAEWYTRTKCPNCNRIGDIIAVCDRYVQRVEQGGLLRCSRSCGITDTGWTFTLKERIKQ